MQINGKTLTQTRIYHWPLNKINHSNVSIPGIVTRSHMRHTLIFKTNAGREIACINGQRRGNVSAKLPVQKNGKLLHSYTNDGSILLVEGSKANFMLSHNIGRIVPVVIWAAGKVRTNEAKIISAKFDTKDLSRAELTKLSDYDTETTLSIDKYSDLTKALTLQLDKPTEIKNLFYKNNARRHLQLISVEAKTAKGWQTVGFTGKQGRLIRLNQAKAIAIRLNFGSSKHKVDISELHLYK